MLKYILLYFLLYHLSYRIAYSDVLSLAVGYYAIHVRSTRTLLSHLPDLTYITSLPAHQQKRRRCSSIIWLSPRRNFSCLSQRRIPLGIMLFHNYGGYRTIF
jgi:hypothetical protein